MDSQGRHGAACPSRLVWDLHVVPQGTTFGGGFPLSPRTVNGVARLCWEKPKEGTRKTIPRRGHSMMSQSSGLPSAHEDG